MATKQTEQEDSVKRWETSKGYLYIKEDNCKGCGYCHAFCPQEVLEESEDFNEKGYHPPEPVSIDDCVNCGYCELICPDFAIWLEEENDE